MASFKDKLEIIILLMYKVWINDEKRRAITIREHPLSTYAPRGRGGSKNLENMRTIVLIGCVKSVQEGGRGSKKPENLRTYLMDAP